MASPQPDKFTMISNELMDAIIKFDFSKRQMKVLLYVIRKTYGFHKKADTMTNGEIAKATGLRRQHVVDAVTELKTMQALHVEKSGLHVRGGEVNLIGINKDYEQWLNSPKTGSVDDQNRTSPKTGLVPKRYATSPKTGSVTSPKTGPSKEIRKERKKVLIDSRFEHWYSTYPRKVAKGQARKAFEKLNPDEDLVAKMIAAVEAQKVAREKASASGEWVPEWKHPATWLNAESWEDEVDQGGDVPDWMREAI